MEEIDLTQLKGAVFSSDGKYRYALWRIWHLNKPIMMYIGLNSSTAGRLLDDPTVSRNMSRADKNGFGGLFHGNLAGMVSANPDLLLKEEDPVGEFNDYYLRKMIEMSERQLCGWGSFPFVKMRAPKVMQMVANPYCVGINKDGEPRHPLYVSYGTPMVKYCR